VAVDYDAIRDGLPAAIPLVGYLGLEYIELGPGVGVVRLPDDERLRNHVGSQHAGGLFSVAEAASGAAFVAGFAERLGDITPLASSAEISYTKLAKGPIDARAELDGADDLLAALDADGKVSFPIDVTLSNGDGETVATATVQWHVRLNS